MKVPALAASLFLALLAQSAAAQNPPQLQTPTGSIEGIVVRVGTGEPIPGARVTLARTTVSAQPLPAAGAVGSPPGTAPGVPFAGSTPSSLPNIPGAGPTVTTDSQGKFVLKDLDAGSYRLTVAANSYARQEYGRRGFTGLGTAIGLGSGQALKDVVVRLTPAGNISGRITDDSGQPAVGVPIQLLRATYNANAERTFQSAGSGRTNDRGEYRLFWITPGRYVLNAGSTAGIAPIALTGGSPNEVQEAYGLTFYPSVSDPAQASVVEVQPGAELSNVDLAVTRLLLYQVRGRIVDGRTGQQPPTANIQIGYRSLAGGSSSRQAQYDATNGTFEVRNVAPGSYFIVATPLSASQSPLDALRGSPGSPRVQMTVTVSNSNVDGILLTIAPSVSIPGRIILEERAVSTLAGLDRLRVRLNSVGDQVLTPTMRQQSPEAQLSPDGTFREDDVTPGDYRVTVTSLPPDFYVKEARFDQTDVLSEPLHFSGSVPSSLDIVLSPKAGQVDGTVANNALQPMPGIQAVLVPNQHRDRPDLYKTAVTDQNGRFTIRGIPPGEYKVFAWEAIDQFAYFDPDLMRQSEQQGKAVRILESSKESVEVRLIPAAGR